MISPRLLFVSLWTALGAVLSIGSGDASAQPLRLTPLANPSPMRWLSSRVSGEGQNGFKDGAFFDAQFNWPLGVAFDYSVLSRILMGGCR